MTLKIVKTWAKKPLEVVRIVARISKEFFYVTICRSFYSLTCRLPRGPRNWPICPIFYSIVPLYIQILYFAKSSVCQTQQKPFKSVEVLRHICTQIQLCILIKYTKNAPKYTEYRVKKCSLDTINKTQLKIWARCSINQPNCSQNIFQNTVKPRGSIASLLY